jgi:hypothetical protein
MRRKKFPFRRTKLVPHLFSFSPPNKRKFYSSIEREKEDRSVYCRTDNKTTIKQEGHQLKKKPKAFLGQHARRKDESTIVHGDLAVHKKMRR